MVGVGSESGRQLCCLALHWQRLDRVGRRESDDSEGDWNLTARHEVQVRFVVVAESGVEHRPCGGGLGRSVA